MVINPTLIVLPLAGSEFFGKDTGNMIDFGIFRPVPESFDFPNRIRFRSIDAGFDILSGADTVPYGVPNILTVIDGSVGGLNVWNGTTQILTGASRAFSWGLNVNLGIGLSFAGARSYNGDWSSIQIFSGEFSDKDRLNMLSYLTIKWGF